MPRQTGPAKRTPLEQKVYTRCSVMGETLRSLCGRFGVSHQAIARRLKSRNPQMPWLVQLSEWLEVSVDQLAEPGLEGLVKDWRRFVVTPQPRAPRALKPEGEIATV